jgi:Tol biopolymer transport system component/DNA-binding winged helix-turn-helix (wHTH) protein
MSLDLTLKNLEFNFNVTPHEQNTVYEFENFRLDAAHKLLFRGVEQVPITPKAVETLLALVETRGEVIGKDELMLKVWGDTVVEESNLAQYLHILRKTLGNTSDGKPYIETLKRRGYRFNGNVRVLQDGNGSSFSDTRGETSVKASLEQHKAVDAIGRRVERHGNVLALADWAAVEETAEIVDNIRDERTGRKFSGLLAVSCLAVAALLAVLLFSWLRSPAIGADQARVVSSELAITPLTNSETVDQATISPDGKYFAYVEYGNDSSHLWLQEVGGSSRIETVDLAGSLIICITFTPDSAAVYYLASREGEKVASLYRVGALGGVPTKILTGISGPVSFSPDASEMAFVRQDPVNPRTQLVVAASDGSRERVVLTRDGSDVIEPNPAWSPDGKQIAVGLMNTTQSITACSITGVGVLGDTVSALSNERWDSCHRAQWLYDSSGLVFIGTKFKEAVTTRRDQIYYLSAASGTARRLTNSGDRHEPWSLGVTKANEILALPFSRISQIWSLDTGADAQTARQITNGQSDGRGGIEALPDGNIFYLSRAGDGFGIFRTEGDKAAKSKAIISDPTMEELRASPDGRFLVFAAKVDGYAHLFRVNPDGTNRQQLTFGETIETDSTVSPDGRWIVYESYFVDGHKARYSLRRVSSDGGDPVSLLSESCETPHFSHDGRMISCIQKETIRVISFENGESLKTFNTVRFPVLNTGSRWTPDDRDLAYRVSEKEVANIWLQPLDGGEPRPMTNFSHGDIYNFTFSPDGLRIYLAHGNQARNAVLIKNFDQK